MPRTVSADADATLVSRSPRRTPSMLESPRRRLRYQVNCMNHQHGSDMHTTSTAQTCRRSGVGPRRESRGSAAHNPWGRSMCNFNRLRRTHLSRAQPDPGLCYPVGLGAVRHSQSWVLQELPRARVLFFHNESPRLFPSTGHGMIQICPVDHGVLAAAGFDVGSRVRRFHPHDGKTRHSPASR